MAESVREIELREKRKRREEKVMAKFFFESK